MRSPYSWTPGKGKNVDPFFPPFSKCFGLLAQNGLRFVRPSPVFTRKPCKTFSNSCPLLSLLGQSLVRPHGSPEQAAASPGAACEKLYTERAQIGYWANRHDSTADRYFGERQLQKERRDAALISGHQLGSPEPHRQREFCVVKDCSCRQRYLVPTTSTLPASQPCQFVSTPVPAPWTHETVRPPAGSQIRSASLLGGEL